MPAETDVPTLCHEMPMRWADLDQLNHVNNVVYVDYASEAMAAHVRAGELQDPAIRRMSVQYLRPLLLSSTPVEVTTRILDDRLEQGIRPRGASADFARVETHLGEPQAPVGEPGPGAETAQVRVRRSDLADGAVSAVKLFEIGQESRIVAVARLRESGDIGGIGTFVVARVDVVFGEPLTWRPEPYLATTETTAVGTKSFTLSTLLDGGRAGRIEAVLVGYDLDQQVSRELTDSERSALQPVR